MSARTLSLRACLALAAASAGCADGRLTRPEPEPGPLLIAVAEGAGQQAEVGTELPHPLVVQVRNQAGAPVGGVVVEWSALRGMSPPVSSTTTDASGRASVRWTLPTTAALDSVVARIKDTDVAVRIAVQGWPGPPARLAAPDSVQLFWYSQNTVVRAYVWDKYGNAVSSAGVRWTALDPAITDFQGTGGEVRLAPVTPGRARLVAWMGALDDTMVASVIHDIAFLEVTPFRLRAMVGDSIPFSVVGIGPEYALREAPVSWSVEGYAISLIPTGDSRAVGIALAPGRVSVSARLRWAPVAFRSVVMEVVTASDWASVSSGAGYNCGLTTRGAAFCWGANHNGFTATDTWDRCFGGGCNTTPIPVRGGLAFASVTPGERTVCGLTTAGDAYCWGGNAFGQIGNGTVHQLTEEVPAAVAGSVRFASLTLGATHTCGLDAGGAAYCWGGNQGGEVGVAGAPVMENPLPLPVSGGLTFRQLAAGGFRTCGITTAGEAYCWGEYIGAVPTRVQGGPAFASVTLSNRHMCALTPAGEAWCWGLNNAGELGLGSTTLSSAAAPTRVLGGHRFVSIAAGGSFTCAVDDAGAAWCWGEDADGKLGNGGANQSAGTPTRVVGNHVFRSVTAGPRHACALAADGSAFCWGNGYGGTLGNGGRDYSSVPVRVSIP